MEAEHIKTIVPIVIQLVVAVIAIGGIYVTHRLNKTKEKTQYKREKLERAYMLTQHLFDGHKAEIYKLKASENVTGPDWRQNRKHPGEVMNELKMIVSVYFSELTRELDDVGKCHRILKEAFYKIDEEMFNGSSTWSSRGKVAIDMEKELKQLGKGLGSLKRGIVSLASKL